MADSIRYITIAEMTDAIRKNFHRIPHDIDFVIGIPRTGMLCGGIISEFLNCPLIDINYFCAGGAPYGGKKLLHWKYTGTERKKTGRVLVVDDSICSGAAIKEAKNMLSSFEDKYEFIYLTVYYIGPDERNEVDIFLEDISNEKSVVYEWNIFHHIAAISKKSIWDIDGVLCPSPDGDSNEAKYIDFLKNTPPLFIPSLEIGELMTYRINKYRDITEDWLKRNGVKYRKLNMFKAKTIEERNNSGIPSHLIKGEYYKKQDWAVLFVESEDDQAQFIARHSGKPCYCVKTNKMYT